MYHLSLPYAKIKCFISLICTKRQRVSQLGSQVCHSIMQAEPKRTRSTCVTASIPLDPWTPDDIVRHHLLDARSTVLSFPILSSPLLSYPFLSFRLPPAHMQVAFSIAITILPKLARHLNFPSPRISDANASSGIGIGIGI